MADGDEMNDEVSMGWEGVAVENPADSDGDEYKQPYDGARGAGGASTGGGSYNVQLGPDGAAMTMTNPDELVDVDLFLEVMLEELADADARVKDAADVLLAGPDHDGLHMLTPRDQRAKRLEDPVKQEALSAARLEITIPAAPAEPLAFFRGHEYGEKKYTNGADRDKIVAPKCAPSPVPNSVPRVPCADRLRAGHRCAPTATGLPSASAARR